MVLGRSWGDATVPSSYGHLPEPWQESQVAGKNGENSQANHCYALNAQKVMVKECKVLTEKKGEDYHECHADVRLWSGVSGLAASWCHDNCDLATHLCAWMLECAGLQSGRFGQ